MTTVRLGITGMHCSSCVALIEESLADEAGVVSATVDLDTEVAAVEFDAGQVSVDRLCAVVADAGYGAVALAAGAPPG